MSRINANKEQPDLLGGLSKRMPEEELPALLRSDVMRRIMPESARMKKRNERFSLLATIATLLVVTSPAIISSICMKISRITIPMMSTSASAFYLYIGATALVLLLADYKSRDLFHKKG